MILRWRKTPGCQLMRKSGSSAVISCRLPRWSIGNIRHTTARLLSSHLSDMPSTTWTFGSRIWAIALNTWRETMRDRLIVGVLVFLGIVQLLIFLMEAAPGARGPAGLPPPLLPMG